MDRRFGAAKHKNISDRRFGRWTVIRRQGVNQHRQALWLCRCECGSECTVATSALTCGQSQSCGCLQRDSVTDHGLSRTTEYYAWSRMIARCTRPSSNRFDSYAGRGITVCQRWLESFEAFLIDMGECPPGYSIERKDNDGNYVPGNCRWATMKAQAHNRRSTLYINLDGKRASLAEHAEERGANYKRVWKRIRKHGLTPQQAFSMEMR